MKIISLTNKFGDTIYLNSLYIKMFWYNKEKDIVEVFLDDEELYVVKETPEIIYWMLNHKE